MVSLIQLIAAHSDATILVVGAVSTVALALALAFAAHHIWFAGRLDALEEHTKLAELVHGSLLAFTVFVLALVLSDVRTNLGRADDAVSREGSFVARLDRDLGSLGGEETVRARGSLRAYIDTIVRDEWYSLSLRDPALAANSDQALATLVAGVRAAGAAHPESAGALRGLLDKLEEYRQGRLEAATKSVPSIFWWMIAVFLLGAMAMNGRHKLNWTAVSLIAIHMAAIGMVLALIVIMDEPFRGETSISTAPLTKALATRP
ncbi:DUF4239 domain-containing protein [Bosea lathyri]|uniref:DUF4239 domain-containing protein n=1 Tax=Bosea lathyri TaxID=1036778 RepID=A0A1H5SX41_9HYPH|nr:DUF4239 domain-containing protein [Bosea lathyri]SEF55075.1 Protein of unknown function [Bosea lathyri]